MLQSCRHFSTSALTRAMRGIAVKQFGGPEVLQHFTNLPSPPKPTNNQVVIQVKAAGVNPIDTYIRSGAHNMKPSLPFTPGIDGSGIVEEVGPDVKKYKKGDRVYWCKHSLGCYAEKVITEEESVLPLADSLTFSQGAAIGIPYFTAYRALVTKANVRPGQTVLIHGASGATGIACCQIAHSLGARVLGTAGTPEGLDLVLKNGADLVFNHRNSGYLDEIKQAVGGSVDVIIEMLANINLENDLNLISNDGRIVAIGSRGKIEITPRLFMLKESIVTGVFIFKSTPDEWREMISYITVGQKQGWVKPVVGQEFPLDQAPEAHKQVIEHSGGSKGKIVLTL